MFERILLPTDGSEAVEPAVEAADDIVARADEAGVDAMVAVRQGSPREDILTYADEQAIDLIVMGTHGRSGVTRTLLGSVTEAVVRHAEIPAMTVHREPEE